MKHASRSLFWLGLFAIVPACASSDHESLAKGDPFADPSKFENLVSNAFPNPVVEYSLLNGASLTSPAVAVDATLTTDRTPASEKKVEASASDVAYQSLIHGNERFANGTAKGEHRDVARRQELVTGQKPFAIVLSCSDSRVPPELIFDQGLGDLFTIRVAGEVLGSAQVASIEYAIEHLDAKFIVVMGHESCGAVKAAIESSDRKNTTAGSLDLDWLIHAIRPNLKARHLAEITTEDPKLRKPVMANVDAITENLMVRSQIVGEAMAKGDLKIVRGIYSLDTGKVDFWGLK